MDSRMLCLIGKSRVSNFCHLEHVHHSLLFFPPSILLFLLHPVISTLASTCFYWLDFFCEIKTEKERKEKEMHRYFAAFYIEELLDWITLDILFDVGNERFLSNSIWIDTFEFERLVADPSSCQSLSPRKKESYSSVSIVVPMAANQSAPINTGTCFYILPPRLEYRFINV